MKKIILLTAIFISCMFEVEAQTAPNITLDNQTNCPFTIMRVWADCAGGCNMNYDLNYSPYVGPNSTTNTGSVGPSAWSTMPSCSTLNWVAIEIEDCNGNPITLGEPLCGFNWTTNFYCAGCDGGKNITVEFQVTYTSPVPPINPGNLTITIK